MWKLKEDDRMKAMMFSKEHALHLSGYFHGYAARIHLHYPWQPMDSLSITPFTKRNHYFRAREKLLHLIPMVLLRGDPRSRISFNFMHPIHNCNTVLHSVDIPFPYQIILAIFYFSFYTCTMWWLWYNVQKHKYKLMVDYDAFIIGL